MILCDIDGVLAMSRSGDTTCGETIYRTFVEFPAELESIRDAGVALHVVTAKVQAEALQVLTAVGVDSHVVSVVSADRLFWPSVWEALRKRRLPNSVSKGVCAGVLPDRQHGRVVMVDDRRGNLDDMLVAGAIDFGVLVPPVALDGDRITKWFDLNLALRLAQELATGGVTPGGLARQGVTTHGWKGGRLTELGVEDLPSTLEKGQYILALPPVSYVNSPASAPSLESLDTGRVLLPGRPNVVTTVRAGRRLFRRVLRRFAVL